MCSRSVFPLVLLFFSLSAVAQEDTDHWFIMLDETEVIGKIERDSAGILLVRTIDGLLMNLPVDSIEFRETLQPGEAGRKYPVIFPANIQRNLGAGNAFTLPKGKGFYQTGWGIHHTGDYGLTDNLTVGAGWFMLYAGWIHLKAATPIKKDLVQVGINTGYGLTYQSENAAVLTGLITIGNPNLFITTGYGMFWIDGARYQQLQISGQMRTSMHGSMIMEFMYFSEWDLLQSYFILGGRSRLFSRTSFDYGFGFANGRNSGDYLPVVPLIWLGLMVPL